MWPLIYTIHSVLRAGIAALSNDEWYEVRQLDLGLCPRGRGEGVRSCACVLCVCARACACVRACVRGRPAATVYPGV